MKNHHQTQLHEADQILEDEEIEQMESVDPSTELVPSHVLTRAKRAAKSTGITETESEILLQCLGPYKSHTTHTLPTGGIGLALTGHNVGSIDVSRPASIAAGTPWGFHVYSNPTISETRTANGALVGCSLYTCFGGHPGSTTGAAHFETMGRSLVVVVIFAMSELPLTLGDIAGMTADRIKVYGGQVADDLLSHRKASLLTALSVKCINTTPKLSMSGLSTSYKQRVTDSVEVYNNPQYAASVGYTYFGEIRWNVTECQPTDPSLAIPLNSVSMEASKGSLWVVPINFQNQSLAPPQHGHFAWKQSSVDSALLPPQTAKRIASPIISPIAGPTLGLPLGTEPYTEQSATKRLSNARLGTFYTSLGDDASFRIVVHAIVDISVPAGDPLVQYAQQPPPLDIDLLFKITTTLDHLPTAAPADWNSFGTFLRGAMNVVSTIAKPLSLLPGPVGAVAKGINAVEAITSDEQEERRSKRRPPQLPRETMPAVPRPGRDPSRTRVDFENGYEVIRVPASKVAEAKTKR